MSRLLKPVILILFLLFSLQSSELAAAESNIRFLPDQQFYPVLMDKITQARDSIHISMYLFKVTRSKSNPVHKILKALFQAKKRGVDVYVLLEKSPFNKFLNQENEKIAKRLKKAGISVRMDSLKVQTHTKLIVIDQKWTFIGSHNFSYSALKKNHETSLLVHSRDLASKALSYFRDISAR